MRTARGQLLAVALVALIGLSWSLDAPVLMWSGSNFFSGKNVQVQSTVASNQLPAIMRVLASRQDDNLPQNIASVFTKDAPTPEVLVIYLEPSLRSDQISNNKESMTRLKKEVTSSKSSVVMPFVDFEASNYVLVPEAIISVAKSLPTGSKVVSIASGRTHLSNRLASEISGLETIDVSALTSGHSIFKNGALDIMIVELTSDAATVAAKLEQDDKLMDKIQDIVEDATDGNYVSLFTTQTVISPAIQIDFGASTEHLRVVSANVERADPSAPVVETPIVETPSNETLPPGNSTGPVVESNPPNWGAYFPYWFWEGAVWMIVWGFLVLVAINMLMGLQTPTAFLAEKKKND